MMRRGEQCSPEQFYAAAHCHGRTMFAPTAHIWLCVAGGGADAPTHGDFALPCALGGIKQPLIPLIPLIPLVPLIPLIPLIPLVMQIDSLLVRGAACLSSPTAARSNPIHSLAIFYHTVNFYIINGCN